jgi:hypothetical protein
MKAETFVKIGAALAFVTALLFWQDVWTWVSNKPPLELAGEILGFCLKWFYLALMAFLLATLPHYVRPWLKVFRRNGQMRLRQVRRDQRFGGSASQQVKAPRFDANKALLALLSKQAGVQRISGSAMPTQPPPEIRLDI